MYMREQEFCRCYTCGGILYPVRQGDTLFSVSRRFEVSLEDLMDANPFINVYRLEPGMQVCVPVPETEGGGSLGEDGRHFDEGRRVTVKRGAGDCPYGFCADPMRFEEPMR